MDHSPCGPGKPLPQHNPDLDFTPVEISQEHPSQVTPGIRNMAEFNYFLDINETPFVRSLSGPRPPQYCWNTVQEPRNPEHGIWVAAKELLQSITPMDDGEWVERSQSWHDLDRIVRMLYKVAFTQIPNPLYDEKLCQEWHSEHPGGRPIDQTKVGWGMKKLVNTTAAKLKKDLEESIVRGDKNAK
jgi:hypothetical protein